MAKDIVKELKETELFMLAQFIDVLEFIESYEDIEEIKNDIKERKKIYLDIIETRGKTNRLFSLDLNNDYIDKKIKRCKKIYSIQDKCNELHLAYKIGLIDGMKIKK